MAYSCNALLKQIFFAAGQCRYLSLLIVAPALLISYIANAGGGIEKDPIVARLSGTVPINTPVPGYSQPLVPSAYTEVSYTPEGEQTRKIKNIVTLSIIEEFQQFISVDFTATIKVRIDYGHTSSYGNFSIQDLVVDYKKAEGAKYNTKKYFSFEGAEFVKVTVQTITVNPSVSGSLDLRNVLLLENEIRVTQFFNLANNVVPANLQTDGLNTTDDELAVKWNSWTPLQGVTHTQLEWTWVETEMESYYYVNAMLNTDLLFRSNSTRVDLPAKIINYTIPKLYDGNPTTGGKIYFRIRAVNIKENGNRADGPWSSPVIYSFAGHEPNLNWQVTTSFAEEGKRNTVIEYFDGSLRPRQTVTKDNVTKTTVTAETFYDGQGRPALQILPTPGISTIIKYQKDLNWFNGQTSSLEDPAKFFDLQPVSPASSFIEPLSSFVNNSGSVKYYSDKNPEKNNGANKYIPDAEGYPYTVTQYTPDATGRIMKQSGVGSKHQMGGGKETKYYYGTPSQEELDGLFGTEVGNNTHYFKSMVKDANGQMSVSYADMHGRTIATALAGNSPGNLQALPVNNNGMYPNQSPFTVERNLLDDNTNIIKGNAIEAINTLLVPATTTYSFDYELEPDKFQLASCNAGVQLCYDCLYDLEISITDESGDTEPFVWKFSNVSLNPDDNCATSTPGLVAVSSPPGFPATVSGTTINISKELETGSYSIRKTLTISESSLHRYLELYAPESLCKTRQQIIDSVYLVLQAQTGCDDPPLPAAEAQAAACTSCMQGLGANEGAFRSNYLTSLGFTPAQIQTQQSPQLEEEIHTAYQAAYNNCQLLCNTTTTQSLETIRLMMLEDMKPYSGQYAREWDPNNPPTNPPPGEQGWSAPLYNKYDIFATPNSGQPFYKNPKKETGAADLYHDASGNPDGSLYTTDPPSNTVLTNTTKDQFQELFKDTWANSLLFYHPEFKKLKYAEANLAPSYNWIDNFMSVSGYIQATNSSNNYILTTGSNTATPYNDPFYTLATPVADYRDNILAKIKSNYINTGNGNASMWQIAYGTIKCNNYTDPNQRNACIVNAPKQPPYANLTLEENNRLWQSFQGLYENERRKDVNKFIAANTTPAVESNQLIAQKYMLHFPETDQQIANQGSQTGGSTQGAGWQWWPPATPPNSPPTGVNLNPATNNIAAYTGKCDSYIQRWKATLLPCLEANIPDANLRETILTEITEGMKQVCIKGSDAANPYGSSNVSPSYSGSGPHSFEEVIHGVFSSRGIPKSILCNPFIIEWPKPYGKGPRMYQDITAVVDLCACENFSTLKNQAAAANYNPNSLASLNAFLQLNYQETLTQELFQALQNCNSYTQWICDYTLQPVTVSCYDPEPCTSTPLRIISPAKRKSYGNSYEEPGAAPPVSCAEFNYMIGYFYDVFGPTPPANCTQEFTTLFNAWFQQNPVWTWQQISNEYTNLCGGTLNVCSLCTKQVLCPEATNCRNEFVPFNLLSPQPMPEFLKCGFSGNQRCVSCKKLSELTAEFKTYFNSPDDAAPVFNSDDPTDAQITSNSLYAKFLNYRTGLQYNWMVYAQAAQNAGPSCDLANYPNNTNANQNVICGEATPLTDPAGIITTVEPCQATQDQAIAVGNEIWLERSHRLMQQFEAGYKAKCFAVQNTERFVVSYINKEYHYTLYYYDMAGSLVKTVPPAGVRPRYDDFIEIEEAKFSGVLISRQHQLITQYRYNSLGQVIAQNSPDANTSNFWYDKLGRLVVSQNAQQAADGKYSYTLYDDLGRITEVGQKPQTMAMTQAISQYVDIDPNDPVVSLKDWILSSGGTREQITFTVYDLPYPSGLDPLVTQQNLRNRVSYTGTIKLATDPAPQQYAATYYTYDIHGNVDVLLQDYRGVDDMTGTDNRYKLIAYDYDLISGKVNMVSYQPDTYIPSTGNWQIHKDRSYHKYKYDAQNRLTEVYTSRDKIVWERDAAYQYYKYGPLSRTEYGQLRTQGIDYAYTIQGWLKGVNSTAITASGGSCPQGTVLGSILNVSDRAQYSQPSVYTAQQEINFNTGFESITNDEFETLLEPGGTVCDPGQGNGNIQYVQGDMGHDGDPADLLNDKVGRDAYGFALNYYNNDYKAIGPGVQTFATGMHNLPQLDNDGMVTGAELFNGNIASMLVNIPKLGIPGNGNSGTNPILYGYRYDQLNRIVGMNAYKNDPANNLPNTFSPVVMSDYRERISYDPNGNILGYQRNGTLAAPAPGGGTGGKDMDQLTYKYLYVKTNNTKAEFIPGLPVTDPLFDHYTNQLASVQDAIGDDKYTIDIDGQNAFNYVYDKIGNLVKDVKEHITNINWTAYGKISSITKDADGNTATTNDVTTITYTYDAGGNRITKTVIPPSGVAKATMYVRDASGNVMSVYEKESVQAIKQTEVHLYGSSRIGMITERSFAPVDDPGFAAGFGTATLSTFTRNEKLFELSNHLGNVLVTISDKKKPIDSDNDGDIDYYESDVVTATDYYPFGMMMPGRKYSATGSYRYGFNGKENDNDVKGEGNQQDYGMRIYDPRLGRFLSVDPLTKSFPMLTPYQYASNSPIENIDLDGLEGKSCHSKSVGTPNGDLDVPKGTETENYGYTEVPWKWTWKGNGRIPTQEELTNLLKIPGTNGVPAVSSFMVPDGTVFSGRVALASDGTFMFKGYFTQSGAQYKAEDYLTSDHYSGLGLGDLFSLFTPEEAEGYLSVQGKATTQEPKADHKVVSSIGIQGTYNTSTGYDFNLITPQRNTYFNYSFSNYFFDVRYMPGQTDFAKGDLASGRVLVTLPFLSRGPYKTQLDVVTSNGIVPQSLGIRGVVESPLKLKLPFLNTTYTAEANFGVRFKLAQPKTIFRRLMSFQNE